METAILLAAYGSTDPEAGAGLDLFGEAVRERFPGLETGWTFTSSFVRRRLAQAGLPAPSPAQALERLRGRGFGRVAVQSLHVVAGRDYEEFAADLKEAAEGISLSLGRPLLDSPDDLERTARALLADPPPSRLPEEALVLMGHGTDHPAGAAYADLARLLARTDPNLILGCLEGRFGPGIAQISDLLRERGVRRAWLRPFLALAGVHARRDLSGPEDSSWGSVLERAGVECRTDLRGLCQSPGLVEIWLDHLEKAWSRSAE